jgi:hypothetical protein
MSTLIADCGLDCGACPAYIATQANDEVAKEQIAAQWRVEFNAPNITAANVTCDGCTSSGRLGGYCPECPVRKCAVTRGVVNCAHCPNYGCEELSKFLAVVPVAKARLEEIRQTL